MTKRVIPGGWFIAIFVIVTCVACFAGSPATRARSVDAPSRVQVPQVTSTDPSFHAPAAPRDGSASGKTEQYTLSHERWRKAVAYSRGGYTLYFVSYFVVVVGLLIILRTGVVGRLRDFAERTSERRWLQGLIFIPLLVLLVELFELPVRLYWHAL